MSGDIIIGIDAGTSVIKAVAFGLDGRVVAQSAKPNQYDERGGGVVEQDAARTWNDTASVLHELIAANDGIADHVAALAVTGQGDGTWLIDADGEPVAPAWIWLDSRAAGVVASAAKSGAKETIYRITGCGLNPCHQSSHLTWMAQHTPEVLARATTAFHCKDWLYFNLTGVRVTDVSEGTFTFGDYRTRTYVPDILEVLGIPRCSGLLPPMIDGSAVTHPLSESAARRTGLKAGLPVSLSYVDIVCSALSAGLYDPDRSAGCTIAGSTGIHMRWFADAGQIELAPEPTGYTIPFPVPGSAAMMQSNMASTLNIDWIVDCARQAAEALGHSIDRRDALLALDSRVGQARPGAALYHPFIHEAGERGPFIDTNARAMFTGLSTRVGFVDLVRSIYEGLSFAATDCYGAMGGVPSEIRICGGAARSDAFCRVLASVVNAPVRRTSLEESGAAGAAMIAAVAVGVFGSMSEAVESWVLPGLGDPIIPDGRQAEQYSRLFPVYRQLRETMPPIWRRYAEIGTMEGRP